MKGGRATIRSKHRSILVRPPRLSACFTTFDKTDWGDGAWQNEEDHYEFWDDATGLPCLINRNRVGALCGYVGVLPGHYLYGNSDRKHTEESSREYMQALGEALQVFGDYNSVPEERWEQIKAIQKPNHSYLDGILDLECHGGITWTGGGYRYAKKNWKSWRKDMFASREQAIQYPHGDAARAWDEDYLLVDSYELYVIENRKRCIYHAGAPNAWFFGFDCSHAGDYSPRLEADMNRIMPDRPKHPWGIAGHMDTYKTVDYVRQQVIELARQLGEIKV